MNERSEASGAGARASGPPWQDTVCATPPPATQQDASHGQVRIARRERYRLRRVLWQVTKANRCRACGRVARGTAVEVHRLVEDGRARATTRGLAVCGSVWLCPVCSAHIRFVRSLEIAEACRRHLEAGGGLLFWTATLRHHLGDGLPPLLDGLLSAHRGVVTGAPWFRQRDRYGVVGRIRSTEVTWGLPNGWHPHLHSVWFTEAPVADADVVALDRWLGERWQAMVGRRGLALPDLEHGSTLEQVVHGEAVGQYVAKLQEAASVPLELARADLKRGRAGRMVPFELLDRASDGEREWLRRWWEYEAGTYGRRCIEWSRGLRERLGLDEERSDEDLVADDVTDEDSLLAVLDAAEWAAVCRTGMDATLLEAAEDDGLNGVVATVAEALRRLR